MRFRSLVILAIIAGCLGSQFEGALAQPGQDLILIASLDKQGVYSAGEKLDLTIFAYLGEFPVDLNEIYVNLTDIYGGSLLPLSPVKTSTGKYLVRYNLSADDAEKRFVVTGNLSGTKKTIYLSVPFDPPSLVYISFPDANSTLVTPGKNVRFYIECFYNTALTDPESIIALLEFEGKQSPLNLSKLSAGRYTGSFDVPQNIQPTTFKITANARIKGKIESASVSLDYLPHSVWYHPVRITETSASFDIGICDQNGSGVKNASVKLNYTTDFSMEKKELQATTNADGVAHFYILPEIIVSSYIYIWGEVVAGGTKTGFQFSVPLASPERPASGLDLIVHNSTYIDGKLKIGGTVFNYSRPFSNSKILYYLKSWGEIHGNFSTDMNGNFSIEIRNIEERYIHPYFGVTLAFVAADNLTLKTEKIIWLNLSTDLWLDSSLSLDAGGVEFGKVLELTLHHKKTFLRHMFSPPVAGVYDGEIKNTGEFYTSWSPVVAGVYFVPVNTTTMRCSFPLPAFAYSGQKNISVAAVYYESGTFVPHMTLKKIAFSPEIVVNLSVVLEGEDYIVVSWEKYGGENFVKYEVLVENEGEWVSVANITDRNKTHYRITAVNGEPLRGGKDYRIKLRIHFDKFFVEDIVSASTQPKVNGFSTIELVAAFLITLIAITIISRFRGKRCT